MLSLQAAHRIHNELMPGLLRIALLLTLTGTGAFAQLGSSCNLDAAGIKNPEAFLAFDRELRAALAKQDAFTVAALTKYPLQINDDRGGYALTEPAAVQSHFQEVFPPAIRTAVSNQKPGDFFCTAEGIMYGNGQIWVEATPVGYAIKVVNLPAPDHASASRIDFVCNAEKHRIIVDEAAGGAVRYRAWNRPRRLSDTPDLEIPAGKASVEGTGPCEYRLWKFNRGGTEYTVSELGGCGEPNSTPNGARGTLDVTAGGKSLAHFWCY